jgi:hypothetical protein
MLYKEVLPGEAFRKLCFPAPPALIRNPLAGRREKGYFRKGLQRWIKSSISYGLYAILEDIILRETRDYHYQSAEWQ